MMVRFSWMLLVTFLAVALELLCAGAGLLFPGSFFVCLYLCMTSGWRASFAFALAACVVVEVVLGRGPTALPLLPLVLLFCLFWRRYGDRRYYVTQAIPGLLFGVGYAIYLPLIEHVGNLSAVLGNGFVSCAKEVAMSAVLAAVAVPVFAAVLDRVAKELVLDRYCNRSTVKT